MTAQTRLIFYLPYLQRCLVGDLGGRTIHHVSRSPEFVPRRERKCASSPRRGSQQFGPALGSSAHLSQTGGRIGGLDQSPSGIPGKYFELAALRTARAQIGLAGRQFALQHLLTMPKTNDTTFRTSRPYSQLFGFIQAESPSGPGIDQRGLPTNQQYES